MFLNAIKLVISGAPKDDYVGFYIPRAKPFMKSTGQNEVETLSTREGVRCWITGQEEGQGKCQATVEYAPWEIYDNWRTKNMNFLVCKVFTYPIQNN